ncbi:MAG: HEAT repeat domain-containing protein [Polyangiaceae bacterium]
MVAVEQRGGLRARRTDRLVADIESAPAEMAARIVHEIARRGDVGAIPRIRGLLTSDDARVREAAADALGKLGALEAGEAVLALFRDARQPSSVRDTCAYALARLRYGAAVPHLVAALDDPEPSVRICAVAAIASIGDPVGYHRVEIASALEQDARVRGAMTRVIEQARRHGALEGPHLETFLRPVSAPRPEFKKVNEPSEFLTSRLRVG